MHHAREITADGLLDWASRCVSELSQRRAEINALNVFPVPDADTGSNMAHTMEAALNQALKGGDVAEALAIGSVRGARGNSGMVISQVLRGVADAAQGSKIDATVLEQSLTLALELASKALSDPVEGTIITVLRAAARASSEALTDGEDLLGVASAAAQGARRALDNTPSQLPALHEAGVVDAGGAGLVIMLDCLVHHLMGFDYVKSQATVDTQSSELELVFVFDGDASSLKEVISALGNSLVVAPMGNNSSKIHIHSRQPGLVIEKAFALGSVTELYIEPLFTSEERPDIDRSLNVGVGSQVFGRVYALVHSDAVGAVLEASGAAVVAELPATNLTPEDIVLMRSEVETAKPTQQRVVGGATILEVGSVLEMLAAMSVYEADQGVEENATAMREAARSMTVAPPASAAREDYAAAARELLRDGGELVTVLSPTPVNEQALAAELGAEVVSVVIAGVEPEVGVE